MPESSKMDDLITAAVRESTDAPGVLALGWVVIVEVANPAGDPPRSLIIRHGNNDGPLPPWQVAGYITGAMAEYHR